MRFASLVLMAAFTIGCGDSALAPGEMPETCPFNSRPGDPYRYLINHLTLPRAREDFAIDLDGDRHPDNQLAMLIGVAPNDDFDPQLPVDQSISSGQVVDLLVLQSHDPHLSNDDCARVTLYTGKSQMPDFSGTGTFAVDSKETPVAFFGALRGGHLDSQDPVVTKLPVFLSLRVALFSRAKPVNLVIGGAHIEFDDGSDRASGAPGLVHGEIQGSIRNEDVQAAIIPALAEYLTWRIATDPKGPSGKRVGSLFDVGGCTNLDGSLAKLGDDIVDPCEAAQNSIIQALLRPDVRIFDSQGKYVPRSGDPVKDSISCAFGFNAVRAKF